MAGDHRMRIFANIDNDSEEELLLDYDYEKVLGERASEWARIPSSFQSTEFRINSRSV